MSSDFLSRMNGSFYGMLRWIRCALGPRVRQPEGRYVSLIGVEPAQQTVTFAALDTFITEVDSMLRREHEYNYCGIVFADDPEQPLSRFMTRATWATPAVPAGRKSRRAGC